MKDLEEIGSVLHKGTGRGWEEKSRKISHKMVAFCREIESIPNKRKTHYF
jgi:hypothetical protein